MIRDLPEEWDEDFVFEGWASWDRPEFHAVLTVEEGERMAEEATIRVELTREEARAILDGLSGRIHDPVVRVIGAKIIVAMEAPSTPLSVDELMRTCCRTGCDRPGVEQSGDGVRWYCARHFREATTEGEP